MYLFLYIPKRHISENIFIKQNKILNQTFPLVCSQASPARLDRFIHIPTLHRELLILNCRIRNSFISAGNKWHFLADTEDASFLIFASGTLS